MAFQLEASTKHSSPLPFKVYTRDHLFDTPYLPKQLIPFTMAPKFDTSKVFSAGLGRGGRMASWVVACAAVVRC